MITQFINYVITLSVVTCIYVYIFDLPTKLTGAQELVEEYYYKNGLKSFIFDIFLIMIYIGIAEYISKMFKITSMLSRNIVVSLTTCVISSIFMFYYLTRPIKSSFFASWFHTAGFFAVIYDIILITTIYFLYNKLTALKYNIY